MKTNKLLLISGLFFATLLVANVISSKVIMVWGIILPAAAICYPWTFAFTDVIGECWGKNTAKQIVNIGFTLNIVALVFYQIAMMLPAAPFWQGQDAFVLVLQGSMRIIVASMISYLISQKIDVHIFHKIREKTNGKHLWLRNNISTATSQLIDTVIFITIAFYGIVPIVPMIVAQYVVKLIIAGLDTPLVYGLVNWVNKSE